MDRGSGAKSSRVRRQYGAQCGVQIRTYNIELSRAEVAGYRRWSLGGGKVEMMKKNYC
jgi:hypothetical protein